MQYKHACTKIDIKYYSYKYNKGVAYSIRNEDYNKVSPKYILFSDEEFVMGDKTKSFSYNIPCRYFYLCCWWYVYF
jgi:Zn/Cd-binding protein ZinT